MIIELEKFLANNQKATKVVVNQFFGLGDIIFIEPIYRHLANLGLKVIAPIQDQYLWMSRHVDYVDFRKKSEFSMDYERFDFGKLNDDTVYLPTRFSDQIFRGLKPHDPSAVRFWMTDKYRVLGLDPSLWRSIRLKRDAEKEEQLKRLVLGNLQPMAYDFCNSFYQNTLNISVRLEDQVKKDLPLVTMSKIDGFSMVDWSCVIEGARRVHTVSTSLIYMIQAIYQPGKEYHLYPRLPEKRFISIEEFLPEYWVMHPAD